jgi:multisubunit Na+/H+ antiporter MnhE subunit
MLEGGCFKPCLPHSLVSRNFRGKRIVGVVVTSISAWFIREALVGLQTRTITLCLLLLLLLSCRLAAATSGTRRAGAGCLG